ncbi:ABC transporter permease [Angustibacter speluncae]
MATGTQAASLLRYRSLIWNFAQRDLKSQFTGTAIGWLWSLVVPIATLATYTIVFSVIFRLEPPAFGNGRDGIFPVWLYCGLVAWALWANPVTSGMGSLLAAGPLLKKIYFPAYAPVLGSVVSVLIRWAVELGLVLVVLGLLTNVSWTWLLVPFWFVLVVAMGTGMSVALAVLNVHFRDLQHLVSVALQLLFYGTPIIYLVSNIPEEWNGIPLRDLIHLNPMTTSVELFRALVYDLQPGAWQAWLYLLGWAAAGAAAGVLVYRARGRDLSEEL